jgi:hypothetical protein
MPRYVILWHELPETHRLAAERTSHWDLMLERGEALRTWALADEPAIGRGGDAQPLPNHRLAYLEYEGPVSGNRGRVKRWDSGTYKIVQESATRLVVELSGQQLTALATLEKGDGSHFWRVSFSELPTRG